MGPCCPACKTRLSLAKTQLDLGTPFACKGCGQSLVVPRGQHLVFVLGLLVLFWLLKSRFSDHWAITLGLALAIGIVGLPAIWLKTQVRLAPEVDKKKPPKP